MPTSHVTIRNLRVHGKIGPDAWGNRGKIQPALISVRLARSFAEAARTDDVRHTTSYSKIAKDIQELVALWNLESGFSSMEQLIFQINLTRMEQNWGDGEMEVEVALPKGSLRLTRGEGRGLWMRQCMRGTSVLWTRMGANEIEFWTVIGVNPYERLERQRAVVNVEWTESEQRNQPDGSVKSDRAQHWRKMLASIAEAIEESNYFTIEALAMAVANDCCTKWPVQTIKLSIEKPNAQSLVEGSGVETSGDYLEYISPDAHEYFDRRPSPPISDFPTRTSSLNSRSEISGLGSDFAEVSPRQLQHTLSITTDSLPTPHEPFSAGTGSSVSLITPSTP